MRNRDEEAGRIEALLARRGYAAQTDAVAGLRLLPAEDALKLVASALNHACRTRRRTERISGQIVLIALCVAAALLATQQFNAIWVLLALLVLLPFVPLLLRVGASPLWINSRAAALDLVERTDRPAHCGALLDLAAVVERIPSGWKGVVLRGALDEKLVQLLPRLDPEGAIFLSDAQRAQLRRMLARLRNHPDACVAILLALGTARDRDAGAEARLLVVKHPSDRVRAAARECLLSLGESQR